MATETFTCGHTAELKPGLFGKGQARIKRIAEYFSRPCLQCAVDRLPAYYAQFTLVKSGEKYSADLVAQKVAERAVKLPLAYLYTKNV